MATNVGSVTSHFPEAENGFTTTTAGSVSSGAATVTLNSVSGYTNGEPVVLVIDPTDAAKKQTFTGIVDTAGVQITSVVWTAGTNQTHALGATVVDYATATHIAMMSKGIKVEHSQDGTHKAALITSRTEDTAPDVGADFLLSYDTSAAALKKVKPSNFGLATGWISGQLPAVSSVTENGNRSADITFASTVASILTPGMGIRTSRTVAAPTQCADLEASSSQYFSKASATGFATGTTWTIKAKVKLESYALGTIFAIDDGTNLLALFVTANGQLQMNGGTTVTADVVTSYQSLPLDKWVDVTASMTIGTPTGEIRIDNVVVPSFVTTSAATTFTVGTPTVYIGRYSSGVYFDGKVAQVAVFNAIISDATLKTYSNQTMTGSETNCKGFWSLNNTLTDLSASANTLTASGGALATNADSPFTKDANGTPGGTYDHAIVTKVATTVATVQYPEGCAIPTSGGISAVDYSGVKAPFGMPVDSRRWRVESLYRVLFSQSSPVTSTWYNLTSTSGTSGGSVHVEPIGEWRRGYEAIIYSLRGVSGTISHHTTLSTANNTAGDSRMIARSYASTILDGMHVHKKESPYQSTTASTLYLNVMTDASSVSSIQLFGNTGDTIIYSDLAYL